MAKRQPMIEALEEEAVGQLDEVRALRTNRSAGRFDENMKRAKVACVIIGSYVRLRATIANEETNRLVAKRIEGGPLPLTDGKS